MTPKALAALRFFRILISVVVCLFAAAMLSSALWSDVEGHITHRAAMPLFMMMFIFPATAFVIGVFTFLLFLMDRGYASQRAKAPEGQAFSKETWMWLIVPALGIPLGYIIPLAGAFCLFMTLYWLMTGRVVGGPGWSIRNFRTTRWDEKISLIVVALLLLSWSKSFVIWSTAAILPVSLGTPEYAVQHERQMNGSTKAALRRFPDPQSCLVRGADAANRQDLLRLDWERMQTSSEVHVCTFRLLHQWGGADEARAWLQAQGFRAGGVFEGYDGTIRVSGSWSVRQNGPRYPTTGPIRRGLSALPYGMSLYAKFSPDGTRLLFVGSSFSTL